MAKKQLPDSFNTVDFGPYQIKLSKTQISYLYEGEMVRVRDVSNQYEIKDFYEHCVKLAKSKNYSEGQLILS